MELTRVRSFCVEGTEKRAVLVHREAPFRHLGRFTGPHVQAQRDLYDSIGGLFTDADPESWFPFMPQREWGEELKALVNLGGDKSPSE